ncbi:MAG TPA: electron transport complex subunit RsxC [Gammaproteobacteria bacterium]|nr:electron transport complex subunit RsxC [Gammaproteobacteria bacterium]
MLEFVLRRRRVGGLRIDAHKALSTQRQIAEEFVPARLYVPLSTQAGAAPEVCVARGDAVLKGQTIALGRPASRTADVHASSSGKVVDFTEFELGTPHGAQSLQCAVIETDGRDAALAPARNDPAPGGSHADRLESIRRAGIVGLGGAAVTTSWKLARTESLATLIINGAECEPYISCDDVLMREHARGILEGSVILSDLIDAQRCIVAIERDKPEAIAAIRAAADALADPRVQLAELPSIYPAGGERQLIELLIGEQVPGGEYPSDIGIVCQNVATVLAVQRALTFGEPLISRVVTLTGNGIAQPRNVQARIGTAIADLVAHHGGYAGNPAALIVGGSMMGIAQSSDAIPVTKGTNCIFVPDADEFGEKRAEWPCIRCGECAAACPAKLLPQELLRAAETENFTQLQTLGVEDCLECGCCDAICPSHIRLTSRFIAGMQALRSRREAQRFAQVAQTRFEERTRRLATEDRKEQETQAALRSRVADERDRKRAIEAALRRSARRKNGSEGV